MPTLQWAPVHLRQLSVVETIRRSLCACSARAQAVEADGLPAHDLSLRLWWDEASVVVESASRRPRAPPAAAGGLGVQTNSSESSETSLPLVRATKLIS